jgi:DNA repair photolyase
VADLVGIARLAASSSLAQEKRSTEYFLLPVRSILNRCDSARMPFEWTINPYRGCEFGCKYCYARYTHEFMELDGAEFEKKIFAKQNAGPLLARDLVSKIEPLTSNFQLPEHIAIGTATDPYQPAEREFGVTRAVLEQLAEREGLSLSITTKSDQVVRDLDLLRRIGERSSLCINVSITTPRPRLARMLEPRAPRPDLRFAAIRKLRDAGIHAGVFVMPILPGLTDGEADLERLAQMAVEARAEWFSGGVLWLMQSSAKHLLPFIEEKFPRLAADYRKWYSRSAYAPEDYRRMVGARVAALRKKYNLGYRPYAETPAERPASASPQLALALSPCKTTVALATNTAA